MKLIQNDTATPSTRISTGRLSVYASRGAELVHYSLDSATLKLTPRTIAVLPAVIQSGCHNRDAERLYVASSNGGYAAGFAESDEHFLSAFDIDGSGDLHPLGEPVRLSRRPVDVTIDHANAHLLVAYSDPSGISIHRIEATGGIGERVESPTMQLRNYAHQVNVSPDDKVLTICCTGQVIDRSADPELFRGAIHSFRFEDGCVGAELPTVAPNGGLQFSPRDLVFHPDLPLAFVSLERHHALHVFPYSVDGISPDALFRVDTLNEDPSEAMQFTGAVHLHPSGETVYVANRTLGIYHDGDRRALRTRGDNIAVFRINSETGEPTLVQNIDSEGVMPRTIATTPDGRAMVVGNQFEIQPQDGETFPRVPQSLMVYRIAADGRLDRATKREFDMDSGPMVWMDLVEHH